MENLETLKVEMCQQEKQHFS